MDLFNVELDANVVTALTAAAQTLQAHPSYKPSKETNRASMFGRLGMSRLSSESDEDEDDELDPEASANPAGDQPVISLRPASRIVGFSV